MDVVFNTFAWSCFGIFTLFVLTITGVLMYSSGQDSKRYREIERQWEIARPKMEKRIKELEPLARKGDLVAFQEWQRLTGNYTVVDVRKIPDVEFTSVGVSV
jgi:hypothetical protein